MRIYSSSYELMSEMGRELNSYGQTVKPKTYQNKNIEGNEDLVTKEIICQQYCLTSLQDPTWLFFYSRSREWADAEFQERIDTSDIINPGKAWELRKDLWEQFLVNGKFDYTYNERIIHVIKPLIRLLKDDNDTRKAVLPIFNGDMDGLDTDWYDGSRRIPCSMYYDFLIRQNGKGEKVLHICYHQRSSDFVTHFGNDVYLAWRLMEYVAKEVGVKPGYLYHTIDSLHTYQKDWDKLASSLRVFEDTII
nr:MAG: Thymidylate synthase [Bacteriophage sp.]